jgi:hypothetical protein
VHDDTQSGQPSVVNEDLVHAVEEKSLENRRFTILSFSLHFPQIPWSFLHKIASEKLYFQNCVQAGCLWMNTKLNDSLVR